MIFIAKSPRLHTHGNGQSKANALAMMKPEIPETKTNVQ
jgi:hypothetical protein